MARSVGKPKTKFAKMDPVTPQVGLFRAQSGNPVSNKRTPSKMGQVVFHEMEHDGKIHEYRAAGQLDSTDWKVLLACTALAAMQAERFNGKSEMVPLPSLWDKFLSEGIATTKDALRVRTTAYEVLRECGLADNGQNRKRLTQSLIGLSMVKQFIRRGSQIMSGANLLSFAHDESSGELSIGVSPQMARKIIGEDSPQHIRINLDDVRSLKDNAAVILHGALSARIRSGDKRPSVYYIDTLAVLAYGPTTNKTTVRTRRKRILEALAALETLPAWRTMVSDGKACIWRGDVPRIPLGMSDLALLFEESEPTD